MKRAIIPLTIVIATLIGLLTLSLVAFFAPKDTGTGLIANDDIPFYSMPWDDNPFTPGEITTADGKLANWEVVPSSEFCSQCHEKEYREWVVSIHAVSGPDMIYETAIGENEHAHGSRLGTEKIRWCDSCHEPILTLVGEVNPITSVGPNAAGAEGTSCIVCHTAIAAEPLAGNGALTLAINHLTLDPALIMAAPAQHAKEMQAKSHNPLIGESDLCGACHTEIRPTEISGHSPLHFQDTYDEWRKSEYADMGVTCQDCHMNPDPAKYIAKLKNGAIPKSELSHRFVGINYLLTESDLPQNLITFLRGGHPPGDITTEEWKKDLKVQQGLILDLLKEAADLEIEFPTELMAGKENSFNVVITNSGAGHDLPTGPHDQRHMWLELKVTDSNDNTLHYSGWFNDKTGELDPDAVVYIKKMYDAKGELITRHILFDVDRIEFTRKPITAKTSDHVNYQLNIPSSTTGALKIEAKLWYKLAIQEIVKYNLKLDVIVPPVLIAETTTEITISP